jgi:hypothetical protein
LALFQRSASQHLVLLALCFSLFSALLSWNLALLGATSCFYILLFGSTWFWMQQTQLEKQET